MQKKHFRILVAAACLCAGLSFSAYGEETISSVPLSFSWDGAPKGGEAVGTLTATTTSQSFIVEGSEYLKDDDTWDYGEWPCAEIELSAAEGYRFSTPNRRTFSLSGCNVQYKSSEIDSDGSTLILQVYLPASAASSLRSQICPGAEKMPYGTISKDVTAMKSA